MQQGDPPSLTNTIVTDLEYRALGDIFGFPQSQQQGCYSGGSYNQYLVGQVLPGMYPNEPIANRIADQIILPQNQGYSNPNSQYQSQYQVQYQSQYQTPMNYPQNYPPSYQQQSGTPYGPQFGGDFYLNFY